MKIISPKIHSDNRGYFFESYKRDKFKINNLSVNFLQDNEVMSYKGVIRGLHYQLNNPQGKLVRCILGTIIDVAVDIRLGSPTFGKSEMIKLSEKNKKMLYVPEGFAHGYLVKSEKSIIVYKCTNVHDPSDEYGIKWNDKDINLNWNYPDPIISERDLNMPTLKNQKFLPKY